MKMVKIAITPCVNNHSINNRLICSRMFGSCFSRNTFYSKSLHRGLFYSVWDYLTNTIIGD